MKATDTRGTRDRTRRKRATKEQQETLDQQILDVLIEDNPQSVRHVFYRMTDPRLREPVEKSQSGYNRVQRRCLELRREGRLPYGWISDASRMGYHVRTFGSPGEYIKRMAGEFRARLWTPELPHVEVWVESRSLAGVLLAECQALGVSLYPCGGFTSATQPYQAAQEMNLRGRDCVEILYVGDYDPAGLLVDKSLESELRRHLNMHLQVQRLAINPWQIKVYQLPTKPRKESEKRRPDVLETVEAEAMPAKDMRGIVREAVEGFLPPGALDAVRAAEASEREGLRRLGQKVSELGLESVL